jgi:hypothetical protein
MDRTDTGRQVPCKGNKQIDKSFRETREEQLCKEMLKAASEARAKGQVLFLGDEAQAFSEVLFRTKSI